MKHKKWTWKFFWFVFALVFLWRAESVLAGKMLVKDGKVHICARLTADSCVNCQGKHIPIKGGSIKYTDKKCSGNSRPPAPPPTPPDTGATGSDQ